MDLPSLFWLLVILVLLFQWIKGLVTKDNNEDASNKSSENRSLTSYQGENSQSLDSATDLDDTYGESLTQGSYWDGIRQKVLDRDGHKCARCGVKDNLTIDHITQLSVGGKNDLNNLQILCVDCHEKKDGHKIFNENYKPNDNYGKNHKVSKKVATLLKAIRHKSSIKIEYTDADGDKTIRTVWPEDIFKGYVTREGELVNKNRTYVKAYCERAKDNRTFRLDRLKTIDRQKN